MSQRGSSHHFGGHQQGRASHLIPPVAIAWSCNAMSRAVLIAPNSLCRKCDARGRPGQSPQAPLGRQDHHRSALKRHHYHQNRLRSNLRAVDARRQRIWPLAKTGCHDKPAPRGGWCCQRLPSHILEFLIVIVLLVIACYVADGIVGTKAGQGIDVAVGIVASEVAVFQEYNALSAE